MSKFSNFFSENYNLIKHLAWGLDLLFVLLLILQFSGALPSYWNITYLFYFVVFMNTLWLTLKINKIPEEKRKDNPLLYIFTYLFLLSLIVLVLNQLIKNQFIINNLSYFVAISIMLGFLTFYSNKNRVEREIESEKVKEESEERKRLSEFDKKFPRLANFNFEYGISRSWKEKSYFLTIIKIVLSPFVWVARIPYSFIKWMYKEGWSFSIPFVVIAAAFIAIKIGMILTYNGSYLDEYYHLLSGVEIFKQGHLATFTTDGAYLRGFFTSLLTGLFLRVFGQSILIAKIVPAMLGILNFILLYLISKKVLPNRKYILLLLSIYTLNPWVIFNHFYIRFYVFYEFFLLSSILLFFKLIDAIKNKKRVLGYLSLIFLVNILNLLSNDLEMYLILLVNLLFSGYVLLSYTPIRKFLLEKKIKYLLWGLLIALAIFSFFVFNGPIKVNQLVGGASGLNPQQTSTFDGFFFSLNIFFTVFLFLSIIAVKKIRSVEGVLIVCAILLFFIHLVSGNDLQLIRVIFYFLPVYFLISIYSISKASFSKMFFILVLIFTIFAIYNNYPTNFFNAPYVPSEIRYMDNGVYTDATHLCSDHIILVASRPGIAIFYGISPTYYINTNYEIPSWLNNPESKYASYNPTKNQFVEVYSKIPVLTNLSEVTNIYNSNSKVCYIGGGLPPRWVDDTIKQFAYTQSSLHYTGYLASDDTFRMYLYVKN